MRKLVVHNLFKDLDLDFFPHPVTADVSQKLDEDAVKRSVRNLVLMSKYDKPFRPEIDCRITKLLFEPVSPLIAMAIRSNIIDMITSYEPRAKINDVVVTFNNRTNSFDTNISFMLVNSRILSQVSVSIERIR